MSLEELREQIRELDEHIIEAAAKRVALAKRLGVLKFEQGAPPVDLLQESRVLERARRLGQEHGLDQAAAEEIISRLVQAAVTVQETARVTDTGTGAGKTAVILGGAGRMGRWFNRFLRSHGYKVHLLDPAYGEAHNRLVRPHVHTADLVLLATPPSAIAKQYRAWADNPPKGVILDISSIKSPLIEPIRDLLDAGARVASCHPMFGPNLTSLRGADVVVCRTGFEDEAIELFEPTTANIVDVGLEEHDQVMAQVLALAHAASIAFAASLDPATLPVHSTTFGRLEDVAQDVLSESPDVYYEIQSHNPHSLSAVTHLQSTLAELVDAVGRGDATAFKGLMRRGRDAINSRNKHREVLV